jgi:hypothetical protein
LRLAVELDFTHKGVAMKATCASLAALFLTCAAASLAHADPYSYYPQSCPQQAPGMYGAGFGNNYYAPAYCPNLSMNPPWGPWNGFRPCLNNNNGAQGFAGGSHYPVHPFAHGPRDYFMEDLPYDP